MQVISFQRHLLRSAFRKHRIYILEDFSVAMMQAERCHF
jgi:hypothetical protein